VSKEDDSPTTIQFQKGGVVKNGEVAEIVEAAKIVEAALIAGAICDTKRSKISLTEFAEAQRI
jgi:hypothetical protein